MNFPTESSYGWQEVLEGLKQRGVTRFGLVVCDGLPGIEEAVVKVYLVVDIQLFVNHLHRNVQKHVKPGDKAIVSAEY